MGRQRLDRDNGVMGVIGSENRWIDQKENGHALRSGGGTMSEATGI
jgi:hypothetical protein